MYMHTYGRFCWSVMLRAGWLASSAPVSLSSHHNTTVIYIFSGYIQEEAGSPPHWPPIIIIIILILVFFFLKSLVSFPCVSKADWLRKSGRGGASSGFRHTSLARLPSITPLVLDILTLFSLTLRNRK